MPLLLVQYTYGCVASCVKPDIQSNFMPLFLHTKDANISQCKLDLKNVYRKSDIVFEDLADVRELREIHIGSSNLKF